MNHGGIIEDPKDQLAYVLGGSGRFTLLSKATGTRFTYRAKKVRKGVFIFVLTGADNEADFDFYAGMLRADTTTFRRTPDSDAESVKAVEWWANMARQNRLDALEKVEFWHEGKCGRCGRALTTPESIARGLGPVCAER